MAHKDEVIDNFSSAFYKLYAKMSWGIKKACSDSSLGEMWYSNWMLEWQSVDREGNNTAANTIATHILQYATTLHGATFPTLGGDENCAAPVITFNDCPVVPSTNVIINQGSLLNTKQYVVGNSGDPMAGTTSFTDTSLIGKSVEISLIGYGFLTKNIDYSYSPTTGIITLLLGRLFNPLEVYTILSY